MFYGSIFAILASDLADLVEMIYVLVRLTENLQARGALRVCFLIYRAVLGWKTVLQVTHL